MRIATIALLGSVFLLPAAPAAWAGSATASVETAVTITLSAQAEKKAKPKKKAPKEKVEYMKSAAPPEPKK
jgi:anti-sigma28 factor (negative regulator of flagellin synthesis)